VSRLVGDFQSISQAKRGEVVRLRSNHKSPLLTTRLPFILTTSFDPTSNIPCLQHRKQLRILGAASRCTMAGISSGNGNSTTLASAPFTVTALNRWSIANKRLPCKSANSMFGLELTNIAVDKVKVLHVYDFDNTRRFSPFEKSLVIF
jgi:hypothetical protein